MNSRLSEDPERLVGLAGAVAMAVGAFGPWATAGVLSDTGLDIGFDGFLVLALGVNAAVILFAASHRVWAAFASALVGGFFAGFHIAEPGEYRVLGQTVEAEPGWGAILSVAGAAVVAWWAVQEWRYQRHLARKQEEPAV